MAGFALILLDFFRFIAALSRKMLTEAYNPSAAERNHYSPAGGAIDSPDLNRT
jgi:hypothetical protein